MAYLESDYCHTFDDHLTQNQKLTNLTKNLVRPSQWQRWQTTNCQTQEE